MNNFHRKNGSLYCEGVSLVALAKQFGTPLYVYSKNQIRENTNALLHAFSAYPTLPCFAVKANSNLSILKEVRSSGFGADIVSVGELERALIAGINPKTIVYSSIGKRDDEITRALDAGILAFNVESIMELQQINKIAKARRQIATVSLRVNPNIDAKTHPYIATGLYTTKFGIAESEIKTTLHNLKTLSSLKLIGLSTHIGSQITSVRPFKDAALRMAELCDLVKKEGFQLQFIDMGGGFAIRYRDENVPKISEYSQGIISGIKRTGLQLLIEPGRIIVGNAGVLLTKVLALKDTPKKQFVVVDGAMNDLIRPMLYSAYHPIDVVGKPSRKKVKVDLVGPICETGDCFARGRLLPHVKVGEFLTIGCAGAYGFSMASNYNTRVRAAEVLVDGTRFRSIRNREMLKTLWESEL